jgi:hypothetical protein
MDQSPWWQPREADLGWDEPLPDVIMLAPDYGAELPLWGNGFGNISWQCTKFSPGLLDRLAAWQQEFDAHYRWDRGWESDQIRDRWASQVEDWTVPASVDTRVSCPIRRESEKWVRHAAHLRGSTRSSR